MALQLHLALALRFEQNSGLALLLPWEQEILRRLFQLLFAAGLQVVPFVMIALTAYWTVGRSPGEWLGERDDRPRPRRVRPIAVAVAVALTALAAYRIRETDARHVRAHAFIGTAFFERRQFDEAERQFRSAVQGGTSDATAWLGLAAIARARGRRDEAVDLLRRAIEAVERPAERDRLRRRLEDYLRPGPGSG